MNKPLGIIFAGTPEFAALHLRALLDSPYPVRAVYTQPDRPAGRGRQLKASPVKQLALAQGLTVRQPSSLKSAELHDELRAWQADVMVVVAYGLILPRAVLSIPRLGCINVHASLLPRWRGAAPIQRAILAGDTESGVTLMQMDAGLDSGPIILRQPCPILPSDNAQTLHDRLATLGVQVLLAGLAELHSGVARPIPQDDRLACYAAKIDKAEAGLDWQRDAQTLERTVRAFNPWPVAHTVLASGQTLRVWEAELANAEVMPAIPLQAPSSVPPGTIIQTTRAGIDVATGQGVLRLTRMQLAGGRPLTAAEFINAHNLAGQTLGASPA